MRGGVEFSEGLDFSKLGDMMGAGPEGAMPGAEAPAMPGSGGDMAALMAMSRPPVTAEAVDSYTSGQNVNYVRAEEGYEKAYQLFASQGGTALLHTEATELIYGEDGSITGVRAQADDGTAYTIQAKCVILAAGGFSGSMASYYLGSRYYVAYSATQLRAYAESGIPDTTMGFQNTGEGVPACYALGDWVDTVLEYAASRGWAWKVSTLAESDKAIGLPEGTLEAAYAADATVLNAGEDEYFYIIACTGLSISSCGGVEVNEKMQAVRADGSAIENLFVVGNDSFGNIMSTGAEYSIGGDAGMWCMGSADVAAKTAVQMIKAQ